ncbi:VWA domain-containing protein [Nocardioides marmoribigeumensis]|uniref:Ca-activated chloride channel family protein n=1 Tax=Nocardioides marmoribigeumensis TaxID=433649 RepID=A0ABU2BV98_9ACTN|nr:VWA domain-containing protein [Nocardioides marmoribigeumensis]MDR7362186.1 Ca-activated chloride channel family protein [Nocardioides marmoribigeumensis]
MRLGIRTLLLGLTLPTLAYAGVVGPPSDAAGAKRDDAFGRLVLVLDSSGSMKERTAGGETRIDAAKQALGEVVEGLPADAEVGLRVFGSEVFSRRDKGACTDTRNVVPVGPVDRAALTDAVAAYRPYGETPIGNALRGAAKDLGPSGKRTIVLLSDGEPTCAPDPCVVARQLAGRGIDLRINVVGLDVSGRARQVLRCVARAGGGTYYDARSTADLVTSLVKLSVRDVRGFRLEGEPVTGGTSIEDAPTVEAGTYVDTTLPDEGTRYYRVARPEGGGVSVSALIRPPREEANWHSALTVALHAPDGERCTSALGQSFQVIGYTPLTSAGTEYNASRPTISDSCEQADELVAAVTLGDGAPTDFRLQIGTYPAVTDPEQLPEAAEKDGPWVADVRIPRSGPVTPVVGGVTPDDAPALEPGTTYADTIEASEQLVYKVPVAYGQAVRVSARVEPDARADAALGVQGNPTSILALTALGQTLPRAFDQAKGVDGGGFYNGAEPHLVTAVLPPVRWRNVESFDPGIAAHNHAGFVYVVLGMGLLDSERPDQFAAPVRIRAETVGEPAGEPAYAGQVRAPTDESSPTTGTASADSGDANDDDNEEKATADGLPLAALLGGGVVVLLAAAALVLGLRRRAR